MLFSILSLFLASAGAVPAITQMGQSSDSLTIQINLDQVLEPANTPCEQLCDQREVFCEEACKNDECKAIWYDHAFVYVYRKLYLTLIVNLRMECASSTACHHRLHQRMAMEMITAFQHA